jgi:hypothetical protein
MQHLWLICLLLVYTRAQETTTTVPEWNGDPRVCTVDPSASPSDRPLPTFPNKAEFALENVETQHFSNGASVGKLTMYQYIYDYDANKVIMIKKENGQTHIDYFYYEILKKSTYFPNHICVVTDIPSNLDMGMLGLKNALITYKPLRVIYL